MVVQDNVPCHKSQLITNWYLEHDSKKAHQKSSEQCSQPLVDCMTRQIKAVLKQMGFLPSTRKINLVYLSLFIVRWSGHMHNLATPSPQKWLFTFYSCHLLMWLKFEWPTCAAVITRTSVKIIASWISVVTNFSDSKHKNKACSEVR